MRELYEPPQVDEILLMAQDPIALSEGDGGNDGFSGGVPFGLRDTFTD